MAWNIRQNRLCCVAKEVEIEENVWIGERSIVLKGSKIGKNSIIGAGSVVAGDIPENCIFAGNPAKFVKKLDKNDFKTKKAYLRNHQPTWKI
ncbi:MAG: hypothetical protein CM15mP12_6150 [Gammaproteobacteria bacterium]|nr:MAG: hypothetical protein CM15mP12_6150 [Gammaproteobacteria bacterium]